MNLQFIYKDGVPKLLRANDTLDIIIHKYIFTSTKNLFISHVLSTSKHSEILFSAKGRISRAHACTHKCPFCGSEVSILHALLKLLELP